MLIPPHDVGDLAILTRSEVQHKQGGMAYIIFKNSLIFQKSLHYALPTAECGINAILILFQTFRYSKEEIENKVSLFRKMLMDKEGVQESSAVEKDEFGRPM